ncbi:MAG: S9 family peptidase [Gemmatimonadales bacterium]
MKTKSRTAIWQYTPDDSATEPRPLIGTDSIGGEVLDYAWSPAGNAIAYLALDSVTVKGQTGSTSSMSRLVLFQDSPGNFTGPTSRVWERDTLGAYLAIASIGGGQPACVIRRRVVSWKGEPRIEWLQTDELGIIGVPLDASAEQLFFERQVTIVDQRSGAGRHLALTASDAPRYPAWSLSGRRLAYLQYHKPRMDGHQPLIVYAIHAVARSPGASKRLISQRADGLWAGLPPLWSADERTLYVGRFKQGNAGLYAIDLKTRGWRVLTPDTLSVSHYALVDDGKHLLVVMENANQPRELYRLDTRTGEFTRLTHEGGVLSGYPLSRIDAINWPSADGRFTIHGYLLKPPHYERTRRYPLIVMVHGGPGDFYTNSFMRLRFDSRSLPPQTLARAGYLVLLPNPRGDSSYGEEFQAALNGDLAFGPFSDVDRGASALVARRLVDPASIGIYGMSYGGYLAAYTIAQTRRYAAAVIDDGPINLASLFSQTYALGTMSLRFRLDGNPWTQPAAYAAQSPITFVDRVRTPVLMRYGGRSASAVDAIRFSLLPQGLELYAGLKESNVQVEFVLHPDQGHSISDWHLYRDWIDRTMTWFRQWLPGNSSH